MDFFKFIKSLDELLYEVMSWLLFYPLTLWRIIRSPVRTMQDAERELTEDEQQQFDDRLPPPLFLLLTLILVHLVELALVGQNELVRSNVGLRALIADDTSLIIFRILMYSLLPVIAATRLIRARGARLNRQLLKPPFYAQCYAAAVFTLLLGAAGIIVGQPHYVLELYVGLAALAVVWLVAVETRWFAAELNSGLLRGFGQAMWMFLQWLVALILIGIALS
ncbi:MAG TPA: hypothetical protein VGD23_08800 [Sphingomicrobium sp.]